MAAAAAQGAHPIPVGGADHHGVRALLGRVRAMLRLWPGPTRPLGTLTNDEIDRMED